MGFSFESNWLVEHRLSINNLPTLLPRHSLSAARELNTPKGSLYCKVSHEFGSPSYDEPLVSILERRS